MKFSGTISIPQLNLPAYRDALHRRLVEAIQNAAREWLHAAVVEVPVWSGASAATFLKLASAVAFPLGVSPITGVKTRVPLGTSNSTGSLDIDKDAARYTFSYGTTLAHLIYNEFNNANTSPDATLFAHLHTPGPYHFQAKGYDAFDRVASQVTLPLVGGFITEKSIEVGS